MISERSPVYLDYNATAPVRPEVVEAVAAALKTVGNPSSVHDAGRRAKARMEAAREDVARLVGAKPGEIVFTAGGTEANNMAVEGLAALGRRLIVSAIEHDSVREICRSTSGQACVLPVDEGGVLKIDVLREELERVPEAAVVSVMLANNETGVIQPISEVVETAKSFGALVHCDAVQGPGKLAIDFGGIGVDLMTVSAHKFGGPPGIGALVVREGINLPPILHGGGQERGLRPGTENVPGVVGFGAAAASAIANPGEAGRIEAIRDRMEAELRSIAADAIIVGQSAERLPNTSCIVMPGVLAETQVMSLDLEGVEVSAGSACSSGKVSRSHVLEAMGLPDNQSGSAIRVSLGWATQEVDMDRFLAAWGTLYQRLGRRDAA